MMKTGLLVIATTLALTAASCQRKEPEVVAKPVKVESIAAKADKAKVSVEALDKRVSVVEGRLNKLDKALKDAKAKAGIQ